MTINTLRHADRSGAARERAGGYQLLAPLAKGCLTFRDIWLYANSPGEASLIK